MSKIKLYIKPKSEIDNMEYELGSAYFDLTEQKIYFDYDDERQTYSVNVDNNPTGATNVLYGIKFNDEVFKLFPIGTDDVIDDDENLSQILNAKADIGGVYDDIIADKSLSLSSCNIIDRPYIYRDTPIKTNKARMDKVIGGSIVWNQLIRLASDYFTSSNADTTYSDNTATCVSLGIGSVSGIYLKTTYRFSISGHKHLIAVTLNTNTVGNFSLGFAGSIQKTISETNKNIKFMFVQNAESNNSSLNCYKRNPSKNDTFTISNYMCIDLTAMFGTTIADYVYTLETAEEGTGIAWLQSYGFLTEDYYAYKTNNFENVSVSAKKAIGFNLWNEKWEVGGIDSSTGENTSSNSRIRTIDYIPISPNTTYYVKAPYTLGFGYYKADKSYIGQVIQGSDREFIPPEEARYLRFIDTQTTVYNNNICINVSDPSKNGVYEPYINNTYHISPIELRGLFTLDNGELKTNGDIYNANGKIKRKFAIVNLGDLEWDFVSASETNMFQSTGIKFTAVRPLGNSYLGNILCPKYINYTYNNLATKTNIGICMTGNGALIVYDTNYNNVTTFTNAMNGVYLIYELAIPTTQTTDFYEEMETVSAYGWEEFIDYGVEQGTRDIAIPCGNITEYYKEFSIPPYPTTDGTYKLHSSIVDGKITTSWVLRT